LVAMALRMFSCFVWSLTRKESVQYHIHRRLRDRRL
jgi:hypothetical protein